jgi:inner membrane protein
MVGMAIDPWIIVGLLAFSLAVTLITNWLVAGLCRPALPDRLCLGDAVTVAVTLIWVALLYVLGVLAVRYSERLPNPVIGYLAFGVLAFLLSLIRAFLYRRILEQNKRRPAPHPRPWPDQLVHSMTYLLFAIILFLILSWFLRRSANPILFIPLCLGALLPDLDSRKSLPGRLLPFASRRLEARWGHRQEWHTLAANAFVALVTLPLVRLIGWEAWYLISLGFLSHLVLDTLTPRGTILFWPLTRRRLFLASGFDRSPGSASEQRLAAALGVVAIALLLVVDIGPPQPQQVPAPSYEQTLKRYQSTRGNNLIFAYLEGVWQATGRRMSGQFEILNAVGQSFVVLDRFTGQVFTAGRDANDNLYINQITLQTGPPASVKPVELHLEEQRLAEALPILYQMQLEPGLQYIYVSGEVVVPSLQDVVGPTLQPDYAQTSLRRIQAADGLGHYRLSYLTASDLIELANVQVEAADLVIVAVYTHPPTGPTVTPLPSPPPTPESVP